MRSEIRARPRIRGRLPSTLGSSGTTTSSATCTYGGGTSCVSAGVLCREGSTRDSEIHFILMADPRRTGQASRSSRCDTWFNASRCTRAIIEVAGLIEATPRGLNPFRHLAGARRNGLGEMKFQRRLPNWEAM